MLRWFRPTQSALALLLVASVVGLGVTLPVAPAAAATPAGERAYFAIWRPSTGTWFWQFPGGQKVWSQQWGTRGDIPVPGNYGGNSATDFAVWRPSDRIWHVLINGTKTERHQACKFCRSGDVPVPGDYDGDGFTDFAVWRPSDATWHFLPSSPAGMVFSMHWGKPGDIPVQADYDSDGRTDAAVWRPSTLTWNVLQSSDGKQTQSCGVCRKDDMPVPGDYVQPGGRGFTDFAVWRPSDGTWIVIWNYWFSLPGPFLQKKFGNRGDIPAPGDYYACEAEPDGVTDLALWVPSKRTWEVFHSSTQQTTTSLVLWAEPGDIPVPGDYRGGGCL